ncbi:hypothetical protein [Mucilaginibacter polytrichastri]|uniref:TonB C-terminal domain-containing protein n=1 Tax=Mucilaginibacter polytrichastri TaxID=1302689 RepID=A0A1Q6A593_9SPHI|nr:hypothetical protein [Mucilaginibacter polytrichastri]OKS89179.1 hypothetical protein RG47T_4661 [Mucilaginibacter polytrichastri]SFS97568.1 hypothetical protein SAMN04487890_107216 [Mucilaginibacter polytrichastri]
MKKVFTLAVALMISGMAMAQKELAFPFQGGQQVMTSFFKTNFTPSADLKQHNAAGVVILKFTADEKGAIKKIIVYYADDFSLAQPAADLLKKSDHKWIVPDGEKLHDFILPISISFNEPVTGAAVVQKTFSAYYNKRSPVLTNNQIPLDMATLLPTITLKYDVGQ